MSSLLAGKPAPPEILVDVAKLVAQYYVAAPDPSVVSQRVSFGTSGHRGSSFDRTFNEAHVLAITQSICDYRVHSRIDGPLFVGIDTHALSQPAFRTALEVLAGNAVETMIASDAYTPTPAVSRAILTYNHGRNSGLADGIVITPSHNPPESGGFKYNPTNGGPADTDITRWIEARANALLTDQLAGITRMPFEAARRAPSTHEYDFIGTYVEAIASVIDMQAIRASGIRMGVDPLGGAGVDYWPRIAERYGVDLTVVSDRVDPTFAFMTLDWDGRIRMDPSSTFAMQRLIEIKDSYDIAFGCDTDHDRHGIVTKSGGLMPPNHFLATAIDYLFRSRTRWHADAAVGKTIVSSRMIDHVAAGLSRQLVEVPVGFKWFVDGLFDGSLGFGGEESAGASFLRRDGTVWTTDKDGIVPALLAAEMTATGGCDPAEAYRRLTNTHGDPVYRRFEAPATPAQKKQLANLSTTQIRSNELAGDAITRVSTRAPYRDAPIGGVKVDTANGWFAARPSGTEDIYKIYAESFRGADHLQRIVEEAREIVDRALDA